MAEMTNVYSITRMHFSLKGAHVTEREKTTTIQCQQQRPRSYELS